jgi:hypothetical protein
MSQLDASTLRLGHNASAALASLLPAAAWATRLTDATSSGPLAPLGLTAAALLVTGTACWLAPCWATRALLYIPVTAIPMSPAAAHAVLAFAAGAAS